MNETFTEYLEQVVILAKRFGYTSHQVKMFVFDIEECYNQGKTVEECVNIVF